MLLQPDRHRRPAVHRLQAGVHVVDVIDVLRGPEPLRHRKRTRPQTNIQHRRHHVFRPQRRFAAEQVGLVRHVRHDGRNAFRHIVQTRAANRVARIPDEEITGEFVVINGDNRARFAHPGIDGEGHLIVIPPFNILHRAAGFPGKINKPAPAGIPFHQREAPLHRLALQARHGEGTALGAVGVRYHVHAV